MPFYKRFFEISYDLMCVCNKTHFLEVNESMVRLLGYSREELLGRSYFDFIHPDDIAESRRLLATGDRNPYENRYYTKTGKIVWLRWCAHKESDGDVMHCVAKDVTSEKAISTQLGKYVIGLQRSQREALAAKEEAEMMAYAASHDLQEPLRTIINWSAFLKEDFGHLLPTEGQEQLGYIQESAKRGRDLVMDLLQLSRVGRNMAMGPVDSAEIVDRAVLDVEFSARETGAEITRESLPVVWGDASMLRLLFKNLLSNAMKFAKSGESPKIHISVSEDPVTGWTFKVRDDGIGMDPAYVQKVFGVFARLDPKKPGTGIGLAICQKIVHLHNGNIAIESTPGAGATVCFNVVKPEAAGVSDDEQTAAPPAGGGSPPGRKGAGADARADEDRVQVAHRARWGGGSALLASGGSLRDRPSYRPSSPGSESSQGLRLRGVGRG
jgi:PAS domain S-box-containing protein